MISSERKGIIMGYVSPLLNKQLSVIAQENKIGITITDVKWILQDTSWAILLLLNNEYVIFVEQNENPYEQRFTIAQCLWYFFLYRTIVDSKQLLMITWNDEIKKKYHVDPIKEEEVQYFAEELLMPEELIKKARNITKEIDKLSKIFELPIDIIVNRLKSLWIAQ